MNNNDRSHDHANYDLSLIHAGQGSETAVAAARVSALQDVLSAECETKAADRVSK